MTYYAFYVALMLTTHNNHIWNYNITNYAALNHVVPSYRVTIILYPDVAVTVDPDSNIIHISFPVLCTNITNYATVNNDQLPYITPCKTIPHASASIDTV